MSKRNTVAKVGKRAVTFAGDDGGDPRPIKSAKPRHVASKGPSARGPPSDERLLTPKETAEFLRCSVSSLNKWRIYGGGPRFVRVESRVRYRFRDVIAYVDTRTCASTSAG
jgi:hypothetical protein